MKKLHYSWVVWLGCVLMTLCICNLGITTYAVYQPYILAQNGFEDILTTADTQGIWRVVEGTIRN